MQLEDREQKCWTSQLELSWWSHLSKIYIPYGNHCITCESLKTHFHFSLLDIVKCFLIFCQCNQDPGGSINQSIYFGGNTLTIMFNQFQLFSFFLDHWFLLGSWCSLAHREPKWLRNLFPGANFVDCYLGLFCGHIDGKKYSEYTAMRSSSGKVRIWKNWPTTGRDGDRAKHTF